MMQYWCVDKLNTMIHFIVIVTTIIATKTIRLFTDHLFKIHDDISLLVIKSLINLGSLCPIIDTRHTISTTFHLQNRQPYEAC